MATFTGTFEFDDGPATSYPAPATYTENGVTFTTSVTNGNGAAPAANLLQGDGGKINVYEQHFLSDPTSFISVPTSADASFTLAIQNTNGFSKFDGFLSIKAQTPVADQGTFEVWNNGIKIGTLSGANATVSTTNAAGSEIKFINVTAIGPFTSRLVIASINTTVNCFCAGTRIATPDGPRAVEDLAPGMRLRTADGGETTVSWLGEQPVDVRLSHPARVNPIRIAAGALGGGVPTRDLYLSPDHALALDGHLINAGALVNGSTITQAAEMPLDGFTYYHIETEGGHELLLAEGVAAETFIDYAGSDSFVNGDARGGASIPEMDLPRISASRLVPQAIRDRIAARAGVRQAA